jgi:hypothetical protein
VERRTFLVLGAAAVGLAGCTSDPSEPVPPSAPAASSAPRDPDARLREEVATSEVALIAAYRSAIRAAPELASDLAPFVAQHEAHLARVAPGYAEGGEEASASVSPPPDSPSPSGAPTGAPTGSPPGADDATPIEPASSVLVGLAAAEAAAQAQRAEACDAAQDPGLARELCLIAASEAQHATALHGLAAGGSGS